MEDSDEYKNGFPQIEVNKDAVLKMLSKIASYKMEERDLALDRFKRSNEEMGEDDFWLKGKTAIMYLDSACKSSNYLGDMVKDIMKLAYNDGSPVGAVGGLLSDEEKKEIATRALNVLGERRKKLPPIENPNDKTDS